MTPEAFHQLLDMVQPYIQKQLATQADADDKFGWRACVNVMHAG